MGSNQKAMGQRNFSIPVVQFSCWGKGEHRRGASIVCIWHLMADAITDSFVCRLLQSHLMVPDLVYHYRYTTVLSGTCPQDTL